jgi:hypothetical protein
LISAPPHSTSASTRAGLGWSAWLIKKVRTLIDRTLAVRLGRRVLQTCDSLAERSEFELPVPVSKLSSDSHRVLDVEHSPEKCAKVPRARRSCEQE